MGQDRLIAYLIKPRPVWLRTLILSATIAVVTWIRWSLDKGQSGAPFSLYYPIVIVAAVAFGARWAVAAMVLSGVMSLYLFFPPAFAFSARPSDIVTLCLFALGSILVAYFGEALRYSLKVAAEHSAAVESVNRELHHRSRNVAGLVRALLLQARKSADTKQAIDQLEAKLVALFTANEVLKFGLATSCDLQGLMEAVLRPFPADRINLEGPRCTVHEKVVTRLAMALHELGTNATKYGALSNENGAVVIRWSTGHSDERVLLEWVEHGGPAVKEPKRSGLGAHLLKAGGGLQAVDIDYEPDGLNCRITLSQAR